MWPYHVSGSFKCLLGAGSKLTSKFVHHSRLLKTDGFLHFLHHSLLPARIEVDQRIFDLSVTQARAHRFKER